MSKQDFKWPVVSLCDAQLLDVRPEDIIEDGLYRTCNTYRGGGGYDEFNEIYGNRFDNTPDQTQFVVQLKGCPLKCPYCYVTDQGINGKATFTSSKDIINSYQNCGYQVFHLMGGAPALYLEHWKDIAYDKQIDIFHSDFILVEKPYKMEWVTDLPGLHAVSIKEPYIYTPVQLGLLWRNLSLLVRSNTNFYITFTGKPILRDEIVRRFGKELLKDSFVIDIKPYKALKERNPI